MENNRNFFITIALSVLILALWQVFLRDAAQRGPARGGPHRRAAGRRSRRRRPRAPIPAARRRRRRAPGAIPNAPGGDVVTPAGREQALATTSRVKIDTPSLSGSINLTGARLDDLKLKHYTETVDKNSPEISCSTRRRCPTAIMPRSALSATTRPARCRARNGLERRRQCDADAGDAGDADLSPTTRA